MIRGSILLVLAAVVAAGWVLHEWVSPEKVREALTATLRDKLPDFGIEYVPYSTWVDER